MYQNNIMSKKAILFSAQNFTRPVKPQLKGCENDTRIWKKTLKKLDFDINENVKIYRDKKRCEAFSLFSSFIKDLKPKDTGVVFFSGHAIHGYEPNGKKDIEGLLFEDGKVIYEYEILQILQKLNPKAKLILIADCCYARGLSNYKIFKRTDKNMDSFLISSDNEDFVDLTYEVENNHPNKLEKILITVRRNEIASNYQSIPERILMSIDDISDNDTTKRVSMSFTGNEIKIINNSDKDSEEKILFHKELDTEKGNLNSDNYDFLKKIIILREEDELNNINEQVIARGVSEVYDTTHNAEFPDDYPRKVSEYENITFILAEERVENKAFEKKFSDGMNYGVFSYYAVHEILENNSITYEELKRKVNDKLTKETHKKVKKQRIHLESGNTDWNRKLFT